MNDIAITILAETDADAAAIEQLNERTFGPGRFAKTAYRLREQISHRLDLSFTARIGTLLVGSVRVTPIVIGDAKALLLGPLTVEPPFRNHGIGLKLLQKALAVAQEKGHRLVLLVGDEPYYARAGFKRAPKEQIILPGPVDPARVLIAELQAGAADLAQGPVRPDWTSVSAEAANPA